MPIYDFFCEKCEQSRELFLNAREYTARKEEKLPFICEVCGSPMERSVNKANFTLKGDGFYGTKPKP